MRHDDDESHIEQALLAKVESTSDMSSINDFDTNLSDRPLSKELREQYKEAGNVGSQLFMTETTSSKYDYVEVIIR